jgi:predicted nuclease of predicted toxin-antitoxin system
MKLIADENLHRKIINSLKEAGHEMFSIQDNNSGIRDEAILEQYSVADSIIVTQDKDFGDLTFF